MIDAQQLGMLAAGALLIALGTYGSRLANDPIEPDPDPATTLAWRPAEEVPAFDGDTKAFPIVDGKYLIAAPPVICPACKHDSQQDGCGAEIATRNPDRPSIPCRCTNAFHAPVMPVFDKNVHVDVRSYQSRNVA